MNRPLIVFFAVTFGLSWAVWLPLVAGVTLPAWYFYLAALGPALGTLGALGAEGGRRSLGPWFQLRLGQPGPKLLWVGMLGALGAAVLTALVAEAVVTGHSSWQELGQTQELPGWSPWAVLGLLTVSYGFCEELGWRGWLFPRWAALWGNRKAALAVGGVWCAWHLPAFFCNPTYQAMGWGALGWVLSLTAGSLLLSWLVIRAQGSLWPVVVWHSVFDFLTVSDAASIMVAPVLSVAVLATVPWVWRNLRRT